MLGCNQSKIPGLVILTTLFQIVDVNLTSEGKTKIEVGKTLTFTYQVHVHVHPPSSAHILSIPIIKTRLYMSLGLVACPTQHVARRVKLCGSLLHNYL